MTELTLVSHHLCPYVQRAAIALLEKGVPFRRRMVDLAHKPEWFQALSPLGKVPLLLVEAPGLNQAVLFESSVICEYIEETAAGPKLHLTDALERARHRAWMEFGSAILGDVWLLETARDQDGYEEARRKIAAKFGRIEEVLGEGPFFAGSGFSLVDAVFAPIFRYFDLFDSLAGAAPFADLPRVTAWRRVLAGRPSVKAAVDADYPQRLRDFLVRHEAFLLKQMA
ncbi:glutathione S-transferase [Labrys miyagiensis]|uniref:glutathione transferase n=1 Tax=Labrys miyagiensis TaxID=346912 RepID=A0ABQ6CK02_9HYPH|nr:glutathione S-transferase family protein [Labrys miyagiensis]GLS20048.1 glutathione S-transferase [Labrys miyagiensis]